MVRVLFTDSDWQLLSFAMHVLPPEGYEVIAESRADASLMIARTNPRVIIAPARHLELWEQRCPGSVGKLLERSAVIVTVHVDDRPDLWRKWVDNGCEVLLNPVVHPMQLYAAVESALAARTQRARDRLMA